MPSDSGLQGAGVGESVFTKLESHLLHLDVRRCVTKTQQRRSGPVYDDKHLPPVGEHESLQHDRARESCTAYVQACRNIYGVFLRMIGVVRRLKRQRHLSFVHFRCIITLADTSTPYMNNYLNTLCHIAYACSTMQSSAHYRILRTWYYAVEGDQGPVFV